MFKNFLYLAETEVNSALVIINLLFVFGLELIVALVYRKTHRTLSYSQSFVITFIIMGIVASMIMMVVTENIVGAFALLGAFSLIRFRTIVKETRDIAFVFFALAIGVAVGTSNYTVALIGTFVISGIMFLLYKYNFGSAAPGGHILMLTSQESINPLAMDSIKKYTSRLSMLTIKTSGQHIHEYTLGIKLLNPESATPLVDSLKKEKHVEAVELISGQDAIEY